MGGGNETVQVRAMTPGRLLRRLASLRERAGESEELPRVTVHLRGATKFRGQVVAASGKSAVLTLDNGESCWLEINQVTAVSLQITEDNAHWFGTEERGVSDFVPTRLELQRQARQIRKSLSSAVGRQLSLSIDWGTFGQNEAVLSTLSMVLDQIEDVLQQWLGDAEEPEVFAQRVRLVSVSAAEVPKVELQEETLRICGAFEGTQVVFLGEEELGAVLGKVLGQ